MTRTERTYYLVIALWNLPGWFMHPVYPLFLQSRGLDLFEIGLIFAIFQFGTFLFEVPTGAVADLYGRKASFLLSCVIRTAAFVLYAFADGFAVCAIAEVIDAIGVTLATGAIDAWAVDGVRAEGDHRPADRMFARGQAIVRAAVVVGGIACGYLADGVGFTLTWLFAAGFFVVAFLVGVVTMHDDRAARRASRIAGRGSLLGTVTGGLVAVRDHAVLRMLCLLTTLTAAALMPVMMYWPPHLETLAGKGFWLLGWTWALLNLSALVSSLLVVPLVRRMRREWLLLGLALWRAVFLAAAALATGVGPLVVLLVVYEGGSAARFPLITAWLNEHVGEDLRATVLSVGGMSFMLGGSLGVVLLGLVARGYGIPTAWLVAAALTVLIAPLYLVLGRIAARAAATGSGPTIAKSVA